MSSLNDSISFNTVNFRTSDDKIINVGWEVLIQIPIFRGMISIGNGSNAAQINQDTVKLSETEEELSLFFKVLESFGTLPNTPKELQDLEFSRLTMVLELAEKYCAVAAGLWVEREIMKKAINGKIYDTFRWASLTTQGRQGQWTRDVLSLYIFAERLDLGDLVEIAAKLTLTLMPDVIKKIPDELDRFFGRKEHLIPLMEFHQRWEKQKNQILKDPVFTRQEQYEMDQYEALMEEEETLEEIELGRVLYSQSICTRVLGVLLGTSSSISKSEKNH